MKGKTFKMTVGQKIKQLRKDKNLNREKLAAMIGVCVSTVQYWEQEKGEPSIFNCIAIADFFNVSLDELCCREWEYEQKSKI